MRGAVWVLGPAVLAAALAALVWGGASLALLLRPGQWSLSLCAVFALALAGWQSPRSVAAGAALGAWAVLAGWMLSLALQPLVPAGTEPAMALAAQHGIGALLAVVLCGVPVPHGAALLTAAAIHAWALSAIATLQYRGAPTLLDDRPEVLVALILAWGALAALLALSRKL